MNRASSVAIGLALTFLAGTGAGAVPQDDWQYRVGPRDLLEVRVTQVPDLNVARSVGDDGTIDMPLIGQFPVAGLSTDEIRDRLATLLSKYVKRPDVSVVIKELGRPVSINGAVGHPGSLGVGRWTLLEALTSVGGLAGNAGKTITIFRRSDNGLSDTLVVDLDDLYHSSDPRWNIPIRPGDAVNVAAKAAVTVYFIGQVKSGPVTLDPDSPTLLMAIAKAGGLSDRASNKIRIKRKGANGRTFEIQANYGRILSGKDPDMQLKQDDIILVKESFF